VSDFFPARRGLEVFMPNEDGAHPSYHFTDAGSCAAITLGPVLGGKDTGRGLAADISARTVGSEFWAAGTKLLATEFGREVGPAPASSNFVIWWDADDVRELADGVSITKHDSGDTLLACDACAPNNGSKATPTLTADLFGDYREEIVWREADNRALRIFTTSEVSSRRLFTLMHDPQYRVAIAWQNGAYNQPPHPSFFFGAGMSDPPAPDIHTR
jgi:rhamnogalacturonan endolyase